MSIKKLIGTHQVPNKSTLDIASGATLDLSGAVITGAPASSATTSGLQLQPSEGAFVDGDKTKLNGIEASADVTDATNVEAAGALMDS